MAEAVLSLVIENVFTWIVAETKLLTGVHGEVEEIMREMKCIQLFIKGADEKAEKGELNDVEKMWMNQFREVAYQIEDITDTYVLQMAMQEHHHQQESCHPQKLLKAMCCVFQLKLQHEIEQEIIQVKHEISTIKERGQNYGFSSSSSLKGGESSRCNESTHDPRVVSLYMEESEVVGIEPHRDHLVEWLVNEESKRVVMAVVGMGGLGKTTLAKKIFDSYITTHHFSNKAWVTVSQSFKVKELLRRTLKRFYEERKESSPPQLDTMDETRLVKALREYLNKKRYVIVFDDVWDQEFWPNIYYAFPDNGQGSRVLITTRSEDVALGCKKSSMASIYKLQPLPEKKGIELFCKKVFFSEGENGSAASELEQLSRDIVRRCEGLPMAIVTTAGMLSTKPKEVQIWKEVVKHFGTELRTNPHFSSLKWILSLSYYDLPYYLKLCLMYFGMFPEDYSIRHARLVRLWIAEGFVKRMREKTAEQVAEEYLLELIRRSLIQVSELEIDGKIKKVRVHDMMREIILSKSEEVSYGRVWEENSSGYDIGLTRRVSIHGYTLDISFLKSNGKVGTRSLSFFNVDNLPGPELSASMKAFRLLKVLDLQEAPIDYLPEQVGDLFHLKYLCLRDTNTRELPKSIGKLHNLQTLDIKRTFIHELPTEIKRLHNLLYLIGYKYDHQTDLKVSPRRGLKLKRGLGNMLNLQKLFLIEVNHGTSLLELRKLKLLRKLGIAKLATKKGKIICEIIASMSSLESLEIGAKTNQMLDLQFNISPPEYLQRVYLEGQLQKVPDWILRLKYLSTISLKSSRMVNEPLNILEDMPHLTELQLQDAFLGEELVFRATGFQKLKILKLYDMSTLKELTIESGALPLLGLLKLGHIPKLNTVPSGVQHMRNLIALRFFDVSNEFAAKLLSTGGKDYWMIKNIQTVLFHYQIEGERGYKTSTLDDLAFLNG